MVTWDESSRYTWDNISCFTWDQLEMLTEKELLVIAANQVNKVEAVNTESHKWLLGLLLFVQHYLLDDMLDDTVGNSIDWSIVIRHMIMIAQSIMN